MPYHHVHRSRIDEAIAAIDRDGEEVVEVINDQLDVMFVHVFTRRPGTDGPEHTRSAS